MFELLAQATQPADQSVFFEALHISGVALLAIFIVMAAFAGLIVLLGRGGDAKE